MSLNRWILVKWRRQLVAIWLHGIFSFSFSKNFHFAFKHRNEIFCGATNMCECCLRPGFYFSAMSQNCLQDYLHTFRQTQLWNYLKWSWWETRRCTVLLRLIHLLSFLQEFQSFTFLLQCHLIYSGIIVFVSCLGVICWELFRRGVGVSCITSSWTWNVGRLSITGYCNWICSESGWARVLVSVEYQSLSGISL